MPQTEPTVDSTVAGEAPQPTVEDHPMPPVEPSQGGRVDDLRWPQAQAPGAPNPGGPPPPERHPDTEQIPGARLSTTEYQGHGVDEPEALEEACRRSLGYAPRPLRDLVVGQGETELTPGQSSSAGDPDDRFRSRRLPSSSSDSDREASRGPIPHADSTEHDHLDNIDWSLGIAPDAGTGGTEELDPLEAQARRAERRIAAARAWSDTTGQVTPRTALYIQTLEREAEEARAALAAARAGQTAAASSSELQNGAASSSGNAPAG